MSPRTRTTSPVLSETEERRPYGAALIDPASLNIGALLEMRSPLRVPRYQRAYAWEEEAVEDFVSDIRNLLDARPATASHFFGGLVCIETTDNQQAQPHGYEVVDGQQRLATFMLALGSLTVVAKEVMDQATAAHQSRWARSAETFFADTERRFICRQQSDVRAGNTQTLPRLTLSLVDDEVFQELMRGQEPACERESHARLITARNALLAMIREWVGSGPAFQTRIDRLLRLRQALLEDSFVIHMVSKDRTLAYRLFSVLNDRGESLSDADLLRTRSLELLERFPREQEQAAKLWDDMLAAPARDVDAFFKAMYPSFTGRRATGGLFDLLAAKFLPRDVARTGASAKLVIDAVQDFSDEFGIYQLLAAGKWPYEREGVQRRRGRQVRAWETERLARLVLTLKHELALPLLLAAARSLPETTFAELVHVLEIFAFRYKNICNGHAGPPGALYYGAAKQMREAKQAGTSYVVGVLRGGLRDLLVNHAPDDRFKDALAEKLRYSNTSQRSNIRELLTILEDYSSWLSSTPPGSNRRPRAEMTKVIDIGQATLEHIYPSRARTADRDNNLEPIKHYLGNLTFFGEDDNVLGGNKPFTDKRAAYRASNVMMTKALASKSRWRAPDVRQRENDLLAMAVRVFIL